MKNNSLVDSLLDRLFVEICNPLYKERNELLAKHENVEEVFNLPEIKKIDAIFDQIDEAFKKIQEIERNEYVVGVQEKWK